MKGRTGSILLLALLSGSAVAHHGFGRFDMNATISLEGTLTDLEFVNPHSYVYFDSTDENGNVVQMGCEMRAATVLRRSGWSPELFIEGAHIEISGRPHRDDPTSCYVETLAIGEADPLERYQQLSDTGGAATSREPRLADGTPNIFGDWAQEQYLLAQPPGPGARAMLVPKSMVQGVEAGDIEPGQIPNNGWGTRPVTLTEAGKAAEASLNSEPPELHPRIQCEITSILFDWVFDGPINRISRQQGQIILEYGRGLQRIVHMDNASRPASVTPTRGGYSTGHWEGDVLVVETSGFLPGRVAGNKPHSEAFSVVERFTLDPDSMALTREYVAQDPLYFEDQYSGTDVVLPAEAPFAVDQCKELAFEYTLEAEQ